MRPGNNLTIAEAVKLAACLYSIYHTGTQSFNAGTPWYGPYVDYAVKNGILKDTYKDYTVTATRSEFAQILSNALPEEALTARNSIADGAIPDVPSSYSYASAVYELYRAGVLTGSDAQGHFPAEQHDFACGGCRRHHPNGGRVFQEEHHAQPRSDNNPDL